MSNSPMVVNVVSNSPMAGQVSVQVSNGWTVPCPTVQWSDSDQTVQWLDSAVSSSPSAAQGEGQDN